MTAYHVVTDGHPGRIINADGPGEAIRIYADYEGLILVGEKWQTALPFPHWSWRRNNGKEVWAFL